MKILSAKEHPDSIYNDLRELDLKDLILIPPNTWLEDRMNEFNYWESFENHGMIYPITVSPHTESWVQERLLRGKTPQHIDENGQVKPGLYVQTGNKRVYWARRNNYTHIEGYYVTDREDKAKIRQKLHIPHTEIPR